MTPEFISIVRDPNGVYVAADASFNLWFWNYLHECWVPIAGPSGTRRDA